MASSVQAKIVLCSQENADLLGSVADTVISITAEFVEQLPLNPHQLKCDATSHNAAYIIATSGSTGIPKLTLIEHGSYCSGVKAHAPGMLMDSTNPLRVLQFASHTFDASLVEILSPLMLGGTVCIPDEETRLNNIAKAINDMNVTWTCLTPTFVRFLKPSMAPGLVTIALVGEAMSQLDLETWSKVQNLVNAYGPSECSVAAVTNPRVTSETDPKNIGYPVGIHPWIVDSDDYHKLVPVGCTGELLAEGNTLARCYFNDDQKTAQAFVKNPKWAEGRDFRGYLTGDLVRQNSDGSLNFIGRKDTQVVSSYANINAFGFRITYRQKFHGQRIELGEIEHYLNADPNIEHGLVVLPKSGYCKERLVSIVSLSRSLVDGYMKDRIPLKLVDDSEQLDVEFEIDAMRGRLAGRLPTYMVPSTWVIVESLPLLASGKLNRKNILGWVEDMSENVYRQIHPTAEPGGSPEQPDSFGDTQLPVDAEVTLRNIWSYVLNLPQAQVSLRSFLSLGGDSISAMQAMGQCRKNGIGLTVQEILRSKSIIDLASCAKEVHMPCYDEEEEVERAFDLSPIQYLWFKLPNQGSLKSSHFNQSFFLRIIRNTQECEFRQAIETLISRHSMLRARFSQTTEGIWQQRVTKEVVKSYRFRSHEIESQDQATAAIADSQATLDPTNGPLFAVDLFNLKRGDQLVFLVGHHLVIDLVSWRTILEELEELLKDPTTPSMVRPLPFQTWCRLQLEHSRSVQVSKVLPASTIPILDFSYWGITDRENTYGNARNQCFEMDPNITSLFLSQSHNALRTEPVDLLLSTLIYSWSEIFTDRAVPAVYNEGHGREPWSPDTDVSRTVGWFTTVYPVYVLVSASDDLIDTIRRVKDYRRRIVDNGRPYFASRCLTTEGREAFGSHWPWEISFNYLGQYQVRVNPVSISINVKYMLISKLATGAIRCLASARRKYGWRGSWSWRNC